MLEVNQLLEPLRLVSVATQKYVTLYTLQQLKDDNQSH